MVTKKQLIKLLDMLATSEISSPIIDIAKCNILLQLDRKEEAIKTIDFSDRYGCVLRSLVVHSYLNYQLEEEALEIILVDPDSISCLGKSSIFLDLANLLSKYREPEAGLKVVENYIADVDHPYCIPNIAAGDFSFKLGDLKKAIYYYQKAYACLPGNIDLADSYAYALALSGVELTFALQLAESCIKRNMKSSGYLDTYAWVKYKLGDLESAIQSIEKALTIAKKERTYLIEILYHRGCILYKMGKILPALQSWDQAVTLRDK